VKSVYFATDCIEDMHVWMHAMNQAATVQLPPGYDNQHQCVLIVRTYRISGSGFPDIWPFLIFGSGCKLPDSEPDILLTGFGGCIY